MDEIHIMMPAFDALKPTKGGENVFSIPYLVSRTLVTPLYESSERAPFPRNITFDTFSP